MIPRPALFLTGVALATLDLACLNYTNAWTLGHHVEWAAGRGLPEPSPTILRLGMGGTLLGGVVMRFAVGRWKR